MKTVITITNNENTNIQLTYNNDGFNSPYSIGDGLATIYLTEMELLELEKMIVEIVQTANKRDW